MKKIKCEDDVYERPAYTSSHPCPYYAKFAVIYSDNSIRLVCGIHVRTWRAILAWPIKTNITRIGPMNSKTVRGIRKIDSHDVA